MTRLVSYLLCSLQLVWAVDFIQPGEKWLDDRGQHIQAHGGAVVQFGDEFFWYGEDRSQDIPKGDCAVACYSSKDLVHWKYRNRVLTLTSKEVGIDPFVLERPKVFFNQKTKKFIMYMHIDRDRNPEGKGGYNVANIGTAISDSPDGKFTYLRNFRPLGKESRDIGQFIDDDGKAYLIFESRPLKGFYIAEMSDDYLDVVKETSFIQQGIEGGAIVHYNGLYYLIGSQLTGWRVNPNKYATAESLSGPWSEFKDIAPPEKNTYNSQSTNLVKIVGTTQTTVIYLGDRWKPKAQWDSRYVWMPLEINGTSFQLPEPKPWHIDVKTGVVTFAETK